VLQLAAASVIAVGYIDDVMAAIWLLILCVACESGSTSILWTTCTEVAPRTVAGSLAGIMNTAGAFAGMLAPIVTGFILKATQSFQFALVCGGAMVALAALSMLFVVGELKPIALKGYDSSGDGDAPAVFGH